MFIDILSAIFTVLVKLLIESNPIYLFVFSTVAERPGTQAFLAKLIHALHIRTFNMEAAFGFIDLFLAVIAYHLVLL